MMRIKISVATQAFQFDLKRAIHQAMEIGAEGVQFDLRHEISAREYGETARRQLHHYLNERNLELASTHFHLRSHLIAREHLDGRLEAVRTAIQFAGQLKTRLLTFRAGRIPDKESATERKMFHTVLSDLASEGNRQGVVLCLLPAGDSAESLRDLIDSIKTGPVAADADLAGWVLQGSSPVDQLRELHQMVAHVEIRDAIRDVDGIGKEVPVGRGEIDWDEIAALLGEMDYSGWLNVTRTEGTDRVGDITRAIQYLRNLIPRD